VNSAAGALVLSEGRHIANDKSGHSPDIATLTARMAKGDEDAYRMFYERYFSRLLRYLLVVTSGHTESAQEALQMTLLRVARHAKPFASEEALWSWLTVLARSAVVDETRRRSRYLAMLDRFLKRREAEVDAADHEADERFRLALGNELTALPEDERALIVRKYFDGISAQAIAAEAGTTEGAVESRLVRVRRKLREAVLAQVKNEK
jgi:RNA polymerase sigma-70 factor (ECF subfamily)